MICRILDISEWREAILIAAKWQALKRSVSDADSSKIRQWLRELREAAA